MAQEMLARTGALIKRRGWIVLLAAAVIAGGVFGFRTWRAQQMAEMAAVGSTDLSATPPPGCVPVVTEVVKAGPLQARVTYIGRVAPLQEQVVYPRATGWLHPARLRNGTRVAHNQLLAIINAPDLEARVAEASAGYQAAEHGVPVAQSEATQARAEQAACQTDQDAATDDLAKCEASVTSAQNAVVQAQKDVTAAKAIVDYWTSEIARQKRLLDAGAVSLRDYQNEKVQAASAEADLEARQARLSQAQADVQSCLADVRVKRAALTAVEQRSVKASAAVVSGDRRIRQASAVARQARAAAVTAAILSDYRYVRAPFAGEVTAWFAGPGQSVNTNSAILSIVQRDTVRLQASVNDLDARSIIPGSPVTATFANYPSLRLSAAVNSVMPRMDRKTGNAVIEAIVANPKRRLMPGDSVTLTIRTTRPRRSVSIPVSAVVQLGGQPAVWIAAPRASQAALLPSVGSFADSAPEAVTRTTTAHLVSVVTGGSDGRRVEILSGLKTGDEVICQGLINLREGDSIFCKPKSPNSHRLH